MPMCALPSVDFPNFPTLSVMHPAAACLTAILKDTRKLERKILERKHKEIGSSQLERERMSMRIDLGLEFL